ncbi:MAG: recombinase family protein [Candidatus Dormiibacterota bacterium]
MRIGYARVSTQDQRLDVQHEALTRSGCERTFDDTMSGRVSDRPGLQKALEQVREGDTLVVWKLDRLGRSVKQLVDLVSYFEEEDIHFVSITDSIDTRTPAGRFFFHVMASLAEMERELTVERTRAGLETARRHGRIGGRKRVMTDGKVQAAKNLLASGLPPRNVASNLGISTATLYRWLPASQRAEARSG